MRGEPRDSEFCSEPESKNETTKRAPSLCEMRNTEASYGEIALFSFRVRRPNQADSLVIFRVWHGRCILLGQTQDDGFAIWNVNASPTTLCERGTSELHHHSSFLFSLVGTDSHRVLRFPKPLRAAEGEGIVLPH